MKKSLIFNPVAYVFTIVLMTITIFSCQNEAETLSEISSIKKEDLVSKNVDQLPALENDYLVFNSPEHFLTFTMRNYKLSKEDRLIWERSNSFRSMYTDFEKVLDYSETHFDEGDNINFKMLDIKLGESVLFEDDGTVNVNAPLDIWATMLNQQGIVKIEGRLQKYSRNKIVTIENGGLEKLMKVADLSESDDENGVFITTVIEKDGTELAEARTKSSARAEVCKNIGTSNDVFPGAVTRIFQNRWGFKHDNSRNYKFRLEVDITAYDWRAGNGSLAVSLKSASRPGITGKWIRKSARTNVRINRATLKNTLNINATTQNRTKERDDGKWTFYIFSTLSIDDPLTMLNNLPSSEDWNNVCYDIKFTPRFRHFGHNHTQSPVYSY